ncbi:disease resistance protein At4g27190-like [Camellia sinensis]|uniref:disease resistance protein At4g27190-like n=1 Tax=Camellia sinensis TaxID=4442 RepID=UPI001036CF3D|nr:disease resistance protein At4g27190-like [Camellia sinensis]
MEPTFSSLQRQWFSYMPSSLADQFLLEKHLLLQKGYVFLLYFFLYELIRSKWELLDLYYFWIDTLIVVCYFRDPKKEKERKEKDWCQKLNEKLHEIWFRTSEGLGGAIHMTVVERNIERLKDKVETLVTVRDDLQLQVEEAEKNGEIINSAVESWINRVTAVTAETERLIHEKQEFKKGFLGRSWDWNGKLLLWKKANGIEDFVDELLCPAPSYKNLCKRAESRFRGVYFGHMAVVERDIERLKNQLETLVTVRDDLQLQVDEAEKNGEIINSAVKSWINRVTAITAKDTTERIMDESEEVENDYWENWNRKLLLWKKAQGIQVIVDVLLSTRTFHRVSHPAPLVGMVSIVPTGSFEFNSRTSTMKEVMEALRDDEINIIGICGMGGIGKTTMVKDVAIRTKNENLFDEIVMAVVSHSPDLWNIQGQIADNLGFRLGEETLFGRATRLRQRLANGKRILLVLDDVWEWLDLQAIGIPFWGENRGCKVVLTSRSLDVCIGMGSQKNIEVKTLAGEEAWHLFKEMVGDSVVDTPDMQPIAEQVVNECGGLPLALVTIGRALKHKSNSVWTDTLRQLRMPGGKRTLGVNAMVYQALELSYNYLQHEEAKSLFLLCCLYPEDCDIQIEDLVRLGMGLELFEDINGLGEARDRVRALIDQLKSCYLLLDSDKHKDDCIKMHDVVRDVGISIASDSRGTTVFLIRHGDNLRGWPKKHTYENYTSISLMSGNIIELPEGLRCPRLRMLLLACMNDSLRIPNGFFDGMRELQVLNLELISIPLLPSSLPFMRNLHTICLQGCKLDNITLIGELLNLEILSFRDSSVEVLPEEIGKLAKLRLLDLTGCHRLERITPGVISSLVQLEELYMIGSFSNWEADKGESKEGRRNASLRELQSLSDLKILEVYIPNAALLPRNPLFADLTKYKIRIGDNGWWSVFPFQKHLLLKLDKSIALHDGVSKLLKCTELLSLRGKGSRNVVHEFVQDGVQHLKYLSIESCDMLFCLVNTTDLSLDSSAAIFPILESLNLDDLRRLKEICCGQLPEGSFGKLRTLTLQHLPSLTHFLVEDPAQTTVSLHNLRSVELDRCNGLQNLFSLSMARGLVQLQELRISHCEMMKEVIWEGRGEDGHATNKIEFPCLEYMALIQLAGLTSFSRGIDQIEFPQLKKLHIKCLPKVKSFFPNESTQHSDENCNATLESIFPKEVAFPSLEELEIGGLLNASDLWSSELSTRSLCKLRFLMVEDCHRLVKNVVPAHLLEMLPNLEKVEIYNCDLVEDVFGIGGQHGFPLENIRMLIVRCCDKLRNLFSPSIARGLVHLQELIIDDCSMMEEVVANEDGEHSAGGRIYSTLFPQLKHLELRGLPSLGRFCHVIHDWEMPFLDHMAVLNCPKMQTYSPGFVHAPNLQCVKVEEQNWWDSKGKRVECIWIDDLNKTIQHLFEKQQEEEEEDEE